MASDSTQKLWELTIRRSGGKPLEYKILEDIKKIELQQKSGKVVTIVPFKTISMAALHGQTETRQLQIQVSEWFEDGEYKDTATV